MNNNDRFLYAKSILENPLFEEVVRTTEHSLMSQLLKAKDDEYAIIVARLKAVKELKGKFSFYINLDKTNQRNRQEV